MGAITGLLGANSSVQSGAYNAAVARQNAQLSDMAAADAERRGGIEAANAELKGTQIQGKQAAAFGASGVTQAGSPSDVMADTSYFTDINVQTAMNNAAREAWGYRVKGRQFGDQAKQAFAQGEYGAASSFIGGMSSTASQATEAFGPSLLGG